MKTRKLFERIALESISQEKTDTEIEKEVTFYCNVSEPEGLRESDEVIEIKDSVIKLEKGKIRLREQYFQNEGKSDVKLTIKTPIEDESGVNTSKETSISLSEQFMESFKSIADTILEFNRYVFSSKNVTHTVVVDDEPKTVELPSVCYEVDVYKNNPDQAKVDIEVHDLLEAIESKVPETESGNISRLNVKLSHLPFKPTEVFDSSDLDKMKEYWEKVKTV